jgi:hypothetical protein
MPNSLELLKTLLKKDWLFVMNALGYLNHCRNVESVDAL